MTSASPNAARCPCSLNIASSTVGESLSSTGTVTRASPRCRAPLADSAESPRANRADTGSRSTAPIQQRAAAGALPAPRVPTHALARVVVSSARTRADGSPSLADARQGHWKRWWRPRVRRSTAQGRPTGSLKVYRISPIGYSDVRWESCRIPQGTCATNAAGSHMRSMDAKSPSSLVTKGSNGGRRLVLSMPAQ